jgi:adenylate cyclase class 2
MSAQNSSEIEIKFLVHSHEALVSSLKDAGFAEKTASTFESNTLYDNSSGGLRQAGEILRLRQYGDVWRLTHKGKGAEGTLHKCRVERETGVASGEQMDAILRALGFAPTFRYEKYRAEWTDGSGEVVIDFTPIGCMSEIEGAPDWIDRIARALGVQQDDYITASYAELFFQWKKRTGSPALNMTFEECGTPRP